MFGARPVPARPARTPMHHFYRQGPGPPSPNRHFYRQGPGQPSLDPLRLTAVKGCKFWTRRSCTRVGGFRGWLWANFWLTLKRLLANNCQPRTKFGQRWADFGLTLELFWANFESTFKNLG